MPTLYRCFTCNVSIQQGVGLCDPCFADAEADLAADIAWERECGVDGAAAARADFMWAEERGEIDYFG